jgi:Protein of unknown function (DUF2889)
MSEGYSLPLAPSHPTCETPPRRLGSIRRTSHINMVWPEGRVGQQMLRGGARDLLTGEDGECTVLGSASMLLGVGPDRTIDLVEITPFDERAQQLVGARGGGRFRRAIEEALPGQRESGTPLYFLLDDVAGATLIGGFAWSLWPDALTEEVMRAQKDAAQRHNMESICSGFLPGGSAMSRWDRGEDLGHNLVPAQEEITGLDPLGWHAIEPPPRAACMRRRRRIDIWREDEIRIDATFRDSMWDPAGREIVVHEYRVDAKADPESFVLTAINAEPRVLPFRECPLAAPNAARLQGKPIADFRRSVLDTLQSTDCCTHLNDALRGFGEIPSLFARS